MIWALVILAIIIFVFYFSGKKEGVGRFGGPRWGPRGRGWYRNVPGWRGGGWGWGAASPVVVYDYEGPPIGYAPPSYCTGCGDCNNPLCRYCPQCW